MRNGTTRGGTRDWSRYNAYMRSRARSNCAILREKLRVEKNSSEIRSRVCGILCVLHCRRVGTGVRLHTIRYRWSKYTLVQRSSFGCRGPHLRMPCVFFRCCKMMYWKNEGDNSTAALFQRCPGQTSKSAFPTKFVRFLLGCLFSATVPNWQLSGFVLSKNQKTTF